MALDHARPRPRPQPVPDRPAAPAPRRVESGKSDWSEKWAAAQMQKIAEMEKAMGVGKDRRPVGKIAIGVLALVALGAGGWIVMGPRQQSIPPDFDVLPAPDTTPPPTPLARAQEEEPIVEAAPKPLQNLFVIRPGSDGRQYLLYVIREGDDLTKIGEALHKVTGFPRVLTYPVVENAYFKQFFNYDNDQNVDITSPAQVQARVGETLQMIVPVEDYPEFDFATRVNLYNQ